MMWKRVIGQQRVKTILLSALRGGRLPHAYLFRGNEGVGKDAIGLELARVLHCERGEDEACDTCVSCLRMNSLQHPDVKFVTALPVGKGEKSDDPPLAKLSESEVKIIQEQLRLKGANPYHRIVIPRANIIKINSIREVRRESALSTFEKKKRIFIISRADEMGEEASNTILKTLEEPRGDTMLILTSSRHENLLPTIVSRCQQVRFDPLVIDDIQSALEQRNGVDRDQAQLIARLANGSYTQALDLLEEDIAQERTDVLSFLRHVLGTNVVTLSQDIERLSTSRDREMVVRFLGLMLMWFRDASVLRLDGDVINLDQKDDLKSFIVKFPHADLQRAFVAIEEAISLVNKNGYIMLTLLRLSVQLRSAILNEKGTYSRALP